MDYNKVGAIVITYNFDSTFKKSFEISYKQVDHIVIVDNNSNEECIKFLKKIEGLNKVTIIYNDRNYGIARAINQGIDLLIKLKCDWIITLDDDSVLEKDAVYKMLKAKDNINKNNIGAVCPNVYDVNLKEYMYSNEIKISKISKAIQSGAMFNSKVFEKIGLFNEELFIYYVDEEYFEKIILSGYEIYRINNAIIYHSDGCIIKKKLLSKEFHFNRRPYYAIYYRARNGIYMVKKYGLSYLKDIFRDPIKIFLYDDNKCKKIIYYIKGIKDGIFNNLGPMQEK